MNLENGNIERPLANFLIGQFQTDRKDDATIANDILCNDFDALGLIGRLNLWVTDRALSKPNFHKHFNLFYHLKCFITFNWTVHHHFY